MRGVRSLLSRTRAEVTLNADGAANADGERVKAPTLSAFGYLVRVAATVPWYFRCWRTRWRSTPQEGRDVHRDWHRGRDHLDSDLAACLWGLLASIYELAAADGGMGGIGPLEVGNLLRRDPRCAPISHPPVRSGSHSRVGRSVCGHCGGAPRGVPTCSCPRTDSGLSHG